MKNQIIVELEKLGYELKITGNKISVLIDIPERQNGADCRKKVMMEVMANLAGHNPVYSADPKLSSIGGITFPGKVVRIVVKSKSVQGNNSAGISNEVYLYDTIMNYMEKNPGLDVVFVDSRGVEIRIPVCQEVGIVGRMSSGRRKADISLNGIPSSLKKSNAEVWESADSLFGARAKSILDDLLQESKIELTELADCQNVYRLSKEIVIQPTKSEIRAAMFGSDLIPYGGIIVQTFMADCFRLVENVLYIDVKLIITDPKDVPEDHRMFWLIRNDRTRNGGSLGIAGLRPLGVTATRAFGRNGTKDVVYVSSEK